MLLTGNQRRYLRGLGHHLKPVVQVGHQGVTEGLTRAVRQALHDHELVKVKLAEAVEDRHATADELAKGTASELVQVLGRTVLLYKPRPKKPEIVLPKPRGARAAGAAGAAGAAAAAGASLGEEDGEEDDGDEEAGLEEDGPEDDDE